MGTQAAAQGALFFAEVGRHPRFTHCQLAQRSKRARLGGFTRSLYRILKLGALRFCQRLVVLCTYHCQFQIGSFSQPAGKPSSAGWMEGWALNRSEEHTSELQSLMCISYAVFC